MKTKIHSCARLFALFCVLTLAYTNAWGANMYAKLTTSVSGGNGVAYVEISGTAMGTATTRTQGSGGEKNVPKYFDIVAIPNRGYELEKWTLSSASFTSGSTTTPSATVQVNTANPFFALSDKTTSATATAKFKSAGAAFSVKYAEAANGSFTIVGPSGSPTYGEPKEGDGVAYSTYTGDNIKLTAKPDPGYTFIRYYTIDGAGNVKTLGTLFQTEQQTVNIKGLADYSGTVYVCAEFSNNPFAIGERTFETLDAATQAVKTTSSKTILVIGNTTIAPGNYTIPIGVTLLVPKERTSITPTTIVKRVLDETPTPFCYRKLTLADGVNIIVNGVIEVGGTQSAGAQGAKGAGIPVGGYGQIAMAKGSKITFNSGAKLYAWGYVTGNEEKDIDGNYLSGEIDARKGSKVYEQFQMFDWKGGSHSAGLLGNEKEVFPVNQYFIQNVEVPTTYRPGSALIGMTSIAVSNIELSTLSKTTIIIQCDNIGIVGETGTTSMFLMDPADTSEDTWVRKSYDVKNDKQVYDVNSSAELGSMQIALTGVPVLGDLNFNSKDYTLPVTSNLKIHLLDGQMGITQNTVMLPGSEIEIDKTATVSINNGKNLYLYDANQWGLFVFDKVYAQQVKYVPEYKGKPNKRPEAGSATTKPASAAMNVHGTFDVKGALYTTEGGANIYSSIVDAGTVQFTNAAASNSTVSQPSAYKVNTTSILGQELPAASTITYTDASCPSAKLTNEKDSKYSGGDGFSETAGTDAGQSFCFIDIDNDGKGEWVPLTTDGCFVYETKANGDKVYYAKPADYVALKNGKTENADHTYSSADGSRTLILISGECQWWEVEYQEESGLYFCEKNGIYYYYDEEEEWIPKTFKITWQNWDGSILKDEEGFNIIYEVPYGSMPKYNNSTPTRPADEGYYTYNFTGSWLPEFTPVTKDVTYVAQYAKNPVMYTIRWLNANGSEREVGYFQRDEMPVCRTQPADMSTLEWTPAVAPVTGDATYQLQAKTVKTNYTITWKNWDGSILQTTTPAANASAADVLAGYTEDEPTKPALDDMEYEFDGWKPAITAATADAVYVAQFTEKPITYTITWKNWNGTILKTDEVAPKVVPQYTGTTPTKPAVGETEFVFASEWTPAIVAAAEDATYTAVFNQKITGLNVTYARTIADEKEVSDVRITPSGSLTITGSITAQNFYLQATETESGQFLNGENKLTVNGNVYFDLTLNTPARHWHAFGVPWRVDIAATPLKEVETGRTLTLGRDYDIIYYNGATRAAQGPGAHCWEYVVDHGKTLSPGQGYMIAFTSAVQTVRFTKAAGAPVIFNGSNSVTGGTGDDGGWNAIANPMAYHATLNAGPTVGYVHDGGEIGSDGYVPYDINNKKYIVGKAVYVQAAEDKSVVVAAAGSKGVITPVAAPARRAKATDKTYLSLEDYYRVSLADAAGKSGSVYVLPEEDKADQYVIGHDLSQFGMNATKPQLWINRYGTKLALNTTAPIDGVAEFPMSLYAPAAGEYTIALTVQPDDENALYLTKDGEVIWNLSDGACTLTLAKGTAANYGLRIGEKKAPEVATGFGEAVVDAQGKTTKVLIDGKVFIIREDRVYTIDGQLVK